MSHLCWIIGLLLVIALGIVLFIRHMDKSEILSRPKR